MNKLLIKLEDILMNRDSTTTFHVKLNHSAKILKVTTW